MESFQKLVPNCFFSLILKRCLPLSSYFFVRYLSVLLLMRLDAHFVPDTNSVLSVLPRDVFPLIYSHFCLLEDIFQFHILRAPKPEAGKSKDTKDKKEFVQNVKIILNLMRWKLIILHLGTKAGKQHLIIVKCFVKKIIEENREYKVKQVNLKWLVN